MGDAFASSHPVDLTGVDHLVCANAVAMLKFAVEQICDRSQADVGVRAYVNATVVDELRRAHLIKENKGANHLPIRRWQGAAHFKATDVAGTRDDQCFDTAGVGCGAFGVLRRVPAHDSFPLFGMRHWRHISPPVIRSSRREVEIQELGILALVEGQCSRSLNRQAVTLIQGNIVHADRSASNLHPTFATGG